MKPNTITGHFTTSESNSIEIDYCPECGEEECECEEKSGTECDNCGDYAFQAWGECLNCGHSPEE